VIAVDTNLLVYAHREDSPWHARSYQCIKELAETGLDWAIPWPCVHEFLAVVTHPKIYRPPTPLDTAIDQVEAWLESPTLRLLGEGTQYWKRLKETIVSGKVQGAVIHDARIAVLCLESGVTKLWSADRDFSRMSRLRVENPLVK
jgi:toxin-antitoxin system PIN domain toxin